MQIEDYLHGKKLHLALLGRKLENMDKEEWVRLTLMRKVAYNVIQKRSIVGLMTAMQCFWWPGRVSKLCSNVRHVWKAISKQEGVFDEEFIQFKDDRKNVHHTTLNNINIITNQLLYGEIEFDDELRALILLASLPNSWEAMQLCRKV
jgi:acyl-activating enzyme 14